MAYYSAVQRTSTQRTSTQIKIGATEAITGGSPRYTYVPAYQRQEAQRQLEIQKQKTDIQRVESVITEYQRQESLASESLLIARESERNRLLKIQNELITEITRLLMVKAEMMARVKRDEENLILMIVLHRRRLRAFNLTQRNKLI